MMEIVLKIMLFVEINVVFNKVLTIFLYCFLVNKDILEYLVNIIYIVFLWFDM